MIETALEQFLRENKRLFTESRRKDEAIRKMAQLPISDITTLAGFAGAIHAIASEVLKPGSGRQGS